MAWPKNHNHVPEITKHGGLTNRPVFVPSVGQFEQGMLVQISLPGGIVKKPGSVGSVLKDHHSESHFVSVIEPSQYGNRIDPRCLNGTNTLKLSVHGNGASVAAVQNMNIMLGLDEGIGLQQG